MTWSPRRRYSAVAVFSEDLERVVLIHKLRPSWQAGKANFPSGEVVAKDALAGLPQESTFFEALTRHPEQLPETLSIVDEILIKPGLQTNFTDVLIARAHLMCATRKLAEETGLVVAADALKLFCTLRFRDPATGEGGECQFFCCVGDVEAARTMETETVFVDDLTELWQGEVSYTYRVEYGTKWRIIPTLPNLPWLTAMARQTLRGESKAPPFVVYEAEAMS